MGTPKNKGIENHNIPQKLAVDVAKSTSSFRQSTFGDVLVGLADNSNSNPYLGDSEITSRDQVVAQDHQEEQYLKEIEGRIAEGKKLQAEKTKNKSTKKDIIEQSKELVAEINRKIALDQASYKNDLKRMEELESELQSIRKTRDETIEKIAVESQTEKARIEDIAKRIDQAKANLNSSVEKKDNPAESQTAESNNISLDELDELEKELQDIDIQLSQVSEHSNTLSPDALKEAEILADIRSQIQMRLDNTQLDEVNKALEEAQTVTDNIEKEEENFAAETLNTFQNDVNELFEEIREITKEEGDGPPIYDERYLKEIAQNLLLNKYKPEICSLGREKDNKALAFGGLWGGTSVSVKTRTPDGKEKDETLRLPKHMAKIIKRIQQAEKDGKWVEALSDFCDILRDAKKSKIHVAEKGVPGFSFFQNRRDIRVNEFYNRAYEEVIDFRLELAIANNNQVLNTGIGNS